MEARAVEQRSWPGGDGFVSSFAAELGLPAEQVSLVLLISTIALVWARGRGVARAIAIYATANTITAWAIANRFRRRFGVAALVLMLAAAAAAIATAAAAAAAPPPLSSLASPALAPPSTDLLSAFAPALDALGSARPAIVLAAQDAAAALGDHVARAVLGSTAPPPLASKAPPGAPPALVRVRVPAAETPWPPPPQLETPQLADSVLAGKGMVAGTGMPAVATVASAAMASATATAEEGRG